jgi:hypothetical protein
MMVAAKRDEYEEHCEDSWHYMAIEDVVVVVEPEVEETRFVGKTRSRVDYMWPARSG